VVVHAAGGAVGVVGAAGAVTLGPGETLVTGGAVRVTPASGAACAVVAAMTASHFRNGISPSKPTPLSA
jgi:hypothetical protein